MFNEDDNCEYCQVHGKKNNGLVTLDFLKNRQERCMMAGFPNFKITTTNDALNAVREFFGGF